MKYLRKFNNVSDMETALENSEIGIVGLAYNGSTPVINMKPTPPPDPTTLPFYIDVRGSVTLAATSGLQMSTDKTNWSDTTEATLPKGKTYFRVASNQTSPLKPNWTEGDNSDYDIGGNINSLVKTDFVDDTTCYNFSISGRGIFEGRAKLKSAGNLILPATTLTVDYCYNRMFLNCTSLTTAPALPATTLANGCYNGMFEGCTSLTTAPELPAMTLPKNSYVTMFSGCTNLNYIKCLATDISAEDYGFPCTYQWVAGVSATGTFVKHPSMTKWSTRTGKDGIPSGWDVQLAWYE